MTKSTDGGQTWQKVWRFVELYGPLACPDGTPEHDTCDLGQWQNIKAQFGATGPTCGLNAGDPSAGDPAPVKKKTGGCCDAGDGAPISALWAFGVLVLLRRHRAR